MGSLAHVDVTLREGQGFVGVAVVGLDDSKGVFQPIWLYDPWVLLKGNDVLFSLYSALTCEGYPPFLFKGIKCGAAILHLHLSVGNWLYLSFPAITFFILYLCFAFCPLKANESDPFFSSPISCLFVVPMFYSLYVVKHMLSLLGLCSHVLISTACSEPWKPIWAGK